MTTDSRHNLPVYQNLGPGVESVWVADITYIGLRMEFLYLAAILACSRRVVRWTSDRTLAASLTVSTSRTALRARSSIEPGLVHHADRSVQYAALEYNALLT